jgi:tRNA(Ile)-lysidine synthase
MKNDSGNVPNYRWTPLHAHLHHTLKHRRLIPPTASLLVAVSGGQDSLCLIQVLRDLQPKWGWTLAIAHCNHNWRTDAAANADHIRHLAQDWQLPYYERTAADLGTSEAAARTWRYQVLTEMAQTTDCPYVATGHTASDRAETLLYNLLRGSGADGLQALPWQRPLAPGIQLIRPLLATPRHTTAQFCQDHHLPIWDDATNHDLTYARNRIRQELLPYLTTHFNPNTESTLAHTAELLQADVAYLETQATQLLIQARHPSQQGLNQLLLQTAPLALQRRTIRQFLQAVLPIAPNFDHIEKVVALIHAPQRSQTDPFPGGTIAHLEKEWIFLNPPP